MICIFLTLFFKSLTFTINMDISDIEFQLKDNEIISTLNEKGGHLYKAVRYYCANCDNDDPRNKINRVAVKQKFKNRARKLFTAPQLPVGQTEYYYKDNRITILVKEEGQTLASEGWTGYHEQMHIMLNDNGKTYEENKELLTEFLMDASKYFSEKWMDTEDENQKVTVYIWDDYWETLEKSTSRKLSTIYLDGKETEIMENVKDFRSEETEALYKDFGIPYKYNILFHGVPGTGKTSLIFSLASELKMNIAIMTFTNDMNDTILMRCFRRLPENCILVIEDIDALFESRKKNDDLKNNITFSGLLNVTDGIAHIDKQIIIMTTNHPLVLDNALKRPGRVDYTMEFKYSTKSQIEVMFNKFLPKQSDRFADFYKKIKHHKLTTAMIQHFFFGNRKCDNIIDCLPELEKIVNENQYEGRKDLYS